MHASEGVALHQLDLVGEQVRDLVLADEGVPSHQRWRCDHALPPGVVAVVGFALFLGVAYLIYRAAVRERPIPTHPVVLQ